METISAKQWFLVAGGVFFIGFGFGLTLGGFNIGSWLFLFGFVLEIPALILVKRHKL